MKWPFFFPSEILRSHTLLGNNLAMLTGSHKHVYIIFWELRVKKILRNINKMHEQRGGKLEATVGALEQGSEELEQ